jgi:hypothetical protein
MLTALYFARRLSGDIAAMFAVALLAGRLFRRLRMNESDDGRGERASRSKLLVAPMPKRLQR